MLSGGKKKALDCLAKEAAREKVSLTRLETEPGRLPDTLRSALVSLDGEKLWLSVNVGVARYCGFVPARIARTMGEKLVRRYWALFRRRAHTV